MGEIYLDGNNEVNGEKDRNIPNKAWVGDEVNIYTNAALR